MSERKHIPDMQARRELPRYRCLLQSWKFCILVTLLLGVSGIAVRSYFRWDCIRWTRVTGSEDKMIWHYFSLRSTSGGVGGYWTSGPTNTAFVDEYYRWHPQGLDFVTAVLDKPESYYSRDEGSRALSIEFHVERIAQGAKADRLEVAFPYWLPLLALCMLCALSGAMRLRRGRKTGQRAPEEKFKGDTHV